MNRLNLSIIAWLIMVLFATGFYQVVKTIESGNVYMAYVVMVAATPFAFITTYKLIKHTKSR